MAANGSGCKNCPVQMCRTLTYRGSVCASQRARLGLGDPATNGDRFRTMTDEELAAVIMCPYDTDPDVCNRPGDCLACCLEYLQSPAESRGEGK